ncbi:MAG: RecQ family ATP-dependent DNA helicase, partial [Verrucomicrobia bacterium]|nr:RecQ family ATP-dependent DNA helicase [Verrucomicrobiota bacterium]
MDSLLLFPLDNGLFIDIETVPGGQIFAFGACQGDSYRREAEGSKAVASLVEELRARALEAAFVAGHNLIAHDLPLLDAAFAIPEFRELPAIDTLYLSPLAFPRNPYHRLIKNDRLTESSKNHPARDCDASKTLLKDALQALRGAAIHSAQRDRLSLTRWLTCLAPLPWNGSLGFDLVFSALEVPLPSDSDAETLWMNGVTGCCCPTAARAEWTRLLSDSAHGASLAYVLAWLSVAGGDSVVPAWVRHRFREVPAVVRRLRCTPCDDPKCPWCSEVQDPGRQLKRFFNYDGFRLEPAIPDRPGVSLQEEIVRLGMAGEPLLAILPTGGGKSLCFQIPALYRYYTSGALTIVVSPLQALMRDQVEGLIEKTHVNCVAALYGMQTPPEKAQVRDAVRLGGIGILYVSPEQLRNASFKKTIIQREIGCWVFDEAHCLSQWGHDFRPDYIYISRFIRELAAEQGVPVPLVTCVTATAKEDVKNEILAHFQHQLGLQLRLLDGGTSRENLSYRIEKVGEQEKYTRIHTLLQEKIGSGVGAAVVFCATRNRAKDIKTYLASPPRGWSCEEFHAGLDSEAKKRILDEYLGGKLQVVAATNAFGLGIDKEDIRLVIHADTPGSLENYLQEAGRAGRDRNPAECVLLYNDEDLETQFGLLSMAKIEKRDIDQIWRAIRQADRGDGKPVVLTVSEILSDPTGDNTVSFSEEGEDQRGSKVRTAIAVLEKQGFLERDENQTRVFQARPLVADEEEALKKMERLDLSDAKKALWLDVLRLLLSGEIEPVTSLEPFAELPRMQDVYRHLQSGSYKRISPFTPVIQVLNEMARPETGLISKDLLFSARLRAGRNKKAASRLRNLVRREKDLIEALRDSEPSPEGWVPLSIRNANEHLISKGHDSQPNEVVRVLETLAADGRKIGRPAGLLEIGYCQKDSLKLRLSAPWTEILELAELRAGVCAALIELLLDKAKAKTEADETIVLVDFTESEALDHLRSDLTLNLALVRDLPFYLQYILVHLHDNDVIELKNGKALITQSMNLRVLEATKGNQYRRFTKGDYAALTVFYSERIFQIHVMGEYVRA